MNHHLNHIMFSVDLINMAAGDFPFFFSFRNRAKQIFDNYLREMIQAHNHMIRWDDE